MLLTGPKDKVRREKIKEKEWSLSCWKEKRQNYIIHISGK